MSQIIFNKLLNINLLHDYYANGICADLQITPSKETELLFMQYNLFFKSTNKGATLLYASVDDGGTPKTAFEGPVKLTFLFASTSSYFINFTEAELSNIPRSVYYFSNHGSDVINEENNFIVTNEKLTSPIRLQTKRFSINKSSSASYVQLRDEENKETRFMFDPQADDLTIEMAKFKSGTYQVAVFTAADIQIGDTSSIYYNKHISGNIPFAVFEIFLDQSSYHPLAPNYIFNFQSRKTFWRYNILLKNVLPSSNDYTIDAKSISILHTPSDGDVISFEAATASDPILIRSTNKLKLKEKGRSQIGLYKGEENILISSLPNPTPTHLVKSGDDWYSDIYVYV